ncbi:hypothetical protein HAZT_HAZT010309 [Hyalella azteca]|uniref:MKRN2 opposite strand protein-like C-terminal domain-containing protein n=1 Tax=Hyalella azteca TaxID=294128 RepID=A0A6A0GS83_HYAAZ|nr:hypothetical protein HAZT_HAZT010309 [Hyalella azteca]
MAYNTDILKLSSDYESGDDLHIGITDSEGCVHAFGGDGLQSETSNSFDGCLVVNILEDPDDPVWQEYWNTALSSTISSHDWSEQSYDESTYNCYSFVIEFLRTLEPPALSGFPLSKVSFCSSFVVPQAYAAARYIALYRAVQKEGCIPVKTPAKEKINRNGISVQHEDLSGENVTSVEVESGSFSVSTPASKVVAYNDWLAEAPASELSAGEFVSSIVPAVLATSKWSSTVLARRSSPENEISSDSDKAGVHDMAYHVEPNDGKQPDGRCSKFEAKTIGAAAQHDRACRGIVELCSRFEKNTFETFGKPNHLPKSRKPLRREKTWRYGEEPCPENYEGKLMGKIDVTKGFDWEVLGRPSTLSMPGYIYEDGVLPETRC